MEDLPVEVEKSPTEKQMAPLSVESMVIGIVAASLSGLGVGLIFGIIGLVKSKRGMALYEQHREWYHGEGMLRTGRITSIVGIVVGVLAILFWTAYIMLLIWLMNISA